MGSKFKDRICIIDCGTRDSLLRWADRTAHIKDGKPRPPFQQTELPALRDALLANASYLVNLFDHAMSVEVQSRKHYQWFMAELAYPTPVGGGLFKSPVLICSLLRDLSGPSAANANIGLSITLIHKAILMRCFPALVQLIEREPTLGNGFPIVLFAELFQVCVTSILCACSRD